MLIRIPGISIIVICLLASACKKSEDSSSEDLMNLILLNGLGNNSSVTNPCISSNVVSLTGTAQAMTFVVNTYSPSGSTSSKLIGFASGTIANGQSYNLQSTTTSFTGNAGSISIGVRTPASCSSFTFGSNSVAGALGSCTVNANSYTCPIQGGFGNTSYLFSFAIGSSASTALPTDITIRLQ